MSATHARWQTILHPSAYAAARGERAVSVRQTRLMLVIGLLSAAYWLRIQYPDLYMSGYDMPAHVIAAMRLHLLSPLAFNGWLSNFFTQVILFNHGYTTITLPGLLYELVFQRFGLTITEARLTYIHSLIGLISLLSIFYFVSLHYGFRRAAVCTALLSVIPIHVGLSRVHVGTQMIASIFFFGCLICLRKYLLTGRARWKWAYALLVFFYIGSENTFFIGLALQVLYIQLLGGCRSWRERITDLLDIYRHPAVLIAVGLPVAAYLGAAIFAHLNDLDGSYLDRLVTKVYRREILIDPLKVLTWMAELFGPVILVALGTLTAWLVRLRHKRLRPITLFLLILFGLYFLLLNLGSQIERNYVFTLLVPVIVASSYILVRSRLLLATTLLATLVYTLSVVYGWNIFLPTTRNYGSVLYQAPSSEQAVKTLGYLLRNESMHVSILERGSAKQAGLFVTHASTFYYAGLVISRFVEEDIENGALSDYPVYVIGYALDAPQDPDNRFLYEQIHANGLRQVGSISHQGVPLLALYANHSFHVIFDLSRLPAGTYELDPQGLPVFEMDKVNPLFDQEYGCLDRLPKPWLGQFGFTLPADW